MSAYRYEGTDQQGHVHQGSLPIMAVEVFVRHRYRTGWRSLVVRRESVRLGGIEVVAGTRCWWAETLTGELRCGEFDNTEGGDAIA